MTTTNGVTAAGGSAGAISGPPQLKRMTPHP